MYRLPVVFVVALFACTMDPQQGFEPDHSESVQFHEIPAADIAGPTSPGCASTLFRQIFERALPFLDEGTVHPTLFATDQSRIDSMVYIGHEQIFATMAEAIAEARFEVAIQTHVWDQGSDDVARLLAGVRRLEERLEQEGATQPVIVRILANGFFRGWRSRSVEQVRGDIDALLFNRDYIQFELRELDAVGFGFYHVKSLVIDGAAAFLTSANPDDRAARWHEAAFQVQGDAALAILSDFDRAWRQNDTTTITSHRILRFHPAEPVCSPILAVGRPHHGIPFESGGSPQNHALLAAIEGAHEHIRILTPFMSTDAVGEALADAVARGVRVDLVLSRQFRGYFRRELQVEGNNELVVRGIYRLLNERGIENPCERLQVRWYEDLAKTQPNHAQYISIDGIVAIIGSAHVNNWSWYDSHELNLVVDDADITAAWDEQLFNPAFDGGRVECRGRR